MPSFAVAYAPGVPPEIRTALAPLLDAWAWLVPSWCREIGVRYDPGDADGVLSVVVEAPYRFAAMCVHAQWLAEPPEKRSETVAHEFAHILLAPFVAQADRVVEAHVPEGAAQTWASQQLLDAEEGAVCDLVHALVNRPTPAAVGRTRYGA